MKPQTPGPKTRMTHACATLLFFCTLFSLHAESTHMNFDPSDVVASDTKTRLSAVTKLETQRAELIAELLKIVQDPMIGMNGPLETHRAISPFGA